MFEQTLIQPGGAGTKTVSLAASLCAQAALIGLALLTPLIFTDKLPMIRLMQTIMDPPAPPPPPHVELVEVPRGARAMPSQTIGRTLVLPARIPDRAVTIIDEAPPESAWSGSRDGIPGGTGLADGGGGVLDSILRAARNAAPPPRPVERPVTKTEPPPARIRQGGRVQEALILRRVMPVYPVLARQARISGVVRLEGIIGRDGTVQQLRVISGHPLLVKAALEAVRQWLYRPTLLNDDPVEVISPIDVNFHLN